MARMEVRDEWGRKKRDERRSGGGQRPSCGLGRDGRGLESTPIAPASSSSFSRPTTLFFVSSGSDSVGFGELILHVQSAG